MKHRVGVLLTMVLGIVLTAGISRGAQGQQQKISNFDRERAEVMLVDVHNALKKNYYDPTFHGLDIDARYRTYEERVKKSETLADALRTVAAYLSGLDDSHTFFLPPRRSYRAEYGYRLQMIGDRCYVTQARPGTDAAQKLRPGDEVLSLEGYTLNRKNLWLLEYYLNLLAPKPVVEFTMRDPSGNVRKEQVLTKYIEGKRLKDLTVAGGFVDNYNLILEQERQRHLLRQRSVEQGDVLIWKMAVFDTDEDAIDRMIALARKHKTLILDLRGNPGGYVRTLDHMVGSFFDHDVRIAVRRTRKGEDPQIAKSRGKATFTGDLIVLVDSNSASAAELFARVVQLEHRATVVGDRSAGSVMEARSYPFRAGLDIEVFYAASITSADLIMADGKSLEKIGVTPDVIVLPTAAQLAEGQDPVLARAAELAGMKLDPVAAGKLFPSEWSQL